jgi:hypothetical protein
MVITPEVEELLREFGGEQSGLLKLRARLQGPSAISVQPTDDAAPRSGSDGSNVAAYVTRGNGRQWAR